MKLENDDLQRVMAESPYERRVALMDELLAARAAVYPVRDRAYERMLAGAEAFGRQLLREIDAGAFRADSEQIEAGRRLAERPVFICGAMKSGTTLITQLLDGHSDLLVMPGDSHYAQKREVWDAGDFESFAAFWVRRIITPSGKEPFWFLGRERGGMETFLQYLRIYRTSEGADSFQAVVMAMHAALRPGPPFASAWVEKTPENEKHAVELAERYPQAKFVHILRDPLENLASLKRLNEFRGKDFPAKKRAKSLMKLFELAEANARELGPGRYLIVRYADLVGQTEATMRTLAGFLGIGFGPGLLVPTENGRPGVANSMYAESRVEGRVLDQAGNRRYVDAFSPQEIREIAGVCRETCARLGLRLDEGAPS